tara:strand:+ start:478 stop:1350 length:873 start_codon:yes stop_codon:yes gene_type:complete
MKVADMKDEDTLKKMKVLDIRKHIKEFNEHYAIKGYSKVKKDQLINMVLTAQDRIKNSKKPAPKAPKAKASPKAKKASPLTVTKADGSVKELKVRTKKEAPKKDELKKQQELYGEYLDTRIFLIESYLKGEIQNEDKLDKENNDNDTTYFDDSERTTMPSNSDPIAQGKNKKKIEKIKGLLVKQNKKIKEQGDTFDRRRDMNLQLNKLVATARKYAEKGVTFKQFQTFVKAVSKYHGMRPEIFQDNLATELYNFVYNNILSGDKIISPKLKIALERLAYKDIKLNKAVKK